MNPGDPKETVRRVLHRLHPALVGLSRWIHANPELGYEEAQASGWVAEWLEKAGFATRRQVGGLATAVAGSYGPGPLHLVIVAEYDALPVVGHACGHNVICAAGVGAGVALAAVADTLGLRITVLGTPAEESGGGKVQLIEAGVFDDVHAAMMVHTWPQDVAEPPLLAVQQLSVTYRGREAHAAAFPHLGVNALDAMTVAQTAIALLRQQLRPEDRVHGIVTHGGDAANVIPAQTGGAWMVRSTTRARMDEVLQLVRRCFEAGALATGATLELTLEVAYSDMRHDRDLAALYRANAESLGRVFDDGPTMPVSTDMGNVSYEVPAIHPMIGIETGGAVNHQAAFAAACATPSADRAILDGALAMAWTAIDAARDDRLRARLLSGRSTTTAPAEPQRSSPAGFGAPVPAELRLVPGSDRSAAAMSASDWDEAFASLQREVRETGARLAREEWQRAFDEAVAAVEAVAGVETGTLEQVRPAVEASPAAEASWVSDAAEVGDRAERAWAAEPPEPVTSAPPEATTGAPPDSAIGAPPEPVQSVAFEPVVGSSAVALPEGWLPGAPSVRLGVPIDPPADPRHGNGAGRPDS